MSKQATRTTKIHSAMVCRTHAVTSECTLDLLNNRVARKIAFVAAQNQSRLAILVPILSRP